MAGVQALFERYWSLNTQANPLTVAAERCLSVYCLLAGMSGLIISVINIRFLPDFAFEVGMGAITSLLALCVPLMVNGHRGFEMRARCLGGLVITLLALLSVLNGELYNVNNMMLAPAVLTFTLVLGLRDGVAAAVVALCTLTATYLITSAGGGNNSLETVYAGMMAAVVFVFASSAVFRHQMLSAVKELEDARARAEQANQAKAQFLANMSHEIRTPLNGVLGMTSVLALSDLDERQRKAVGVIRTSGDHLLSTLNDILDLAKIDAGQLDVEALEFSVGEVADQMETLYRPQAQSKGIGFSVAYQDGLESDSEHLGDPTRFAQIIHNLLSNALKFTQDGDIHLRFGACPQNKSLTVSVSDTGCGMSEEQLARVFLPFAQAEASTAREYGGTGLGLSIVKQLTEVMKGDLSVESQQDAGTTITVRLPFPQIRHASLSIPSSQGCDCTDLLPSGLSVLVVDDCDTNREVAAGLLKACNVNVVLAANGDEAITQAKAVAFDLVLMDIRMPKHDGFKVFEELRQVWKALNHPIPPVVAMTANIMAHQVESYTKAGFITTLAKPLRQDVMVQTIANVLRGAPALEPVLSPLRARGLGL